jgi:hypothetical protein
MFKIVVKNAVSTSVDKSPFLHFMTIPNCKDLIEFIIRKCCEYWNYDITDGFSLHFDITDELVTKENKSTIIPGSSLKLCSSRSRLASLYKHSLNATLCDFKEKIPKKISKKPFQKTFQKIMPKLLRI